MREGIGSHPRQSSVFEVSALLGYWFSQSVNLVIVMPKTRVLRIADETGVQNVSSERPLRQFVTTKDKSTGRNSKGCITIFHRGGGAKWSQRTIDLKRNTSSVGVVERIEYDPNRTSRIVVVRWVEGATVDHPKKVNSLQKNFTPPLRSYPPSPSKVSFHSLQFLEC
uniref:Large ribosomal subunit protein uL2 RNA-binding domain-containing protein n=1 Tax=Lactuca sativa TaxID=4236 RepID=A0A9R1VEX5_LACSA|nr:hypothetical protein LSAT_V11C500288480 [Lactuca sativa]